MTQNISNIFEHNIKLLGEMDKAVCYFREQQCDIALNLIANSINEVNFIIEAIITDREYFNLVNTESMLEMLTGILEAKKNKDFVLLADLLELQLINFLISVQELIIGKEEILFDEMSYQENISLLTQCIEGNTEIFKEPINTVRLLESGYRIEFTSCGLMTLAAENEGAKFYFHTNSKIQTEAFLLARKWVRSGAESYLIYGLGMGYHIRELLTLAPDCRLEVYEADANVIQLACAFTEMKVLLEEQRLKLIYDPEFEQLENRLSALQDKEYFCVHYPSYKNIRHQKGKKLAEAGLPWLKRVEID